jgi:predicted permease
MAGPRFVRTLARLLLPRADREVVIGDLEEMHAARARRDGADAADRAYARDALASVVARRLTRSRSILHEPLRNPRRDPMLTGLWFDLLAAGRSLRRKPAFAAVAALTLALGVGATTVAFALVNQVLLRPLPGVRAPEDVAYVVFTPLGRTGISHPDFELLRQDASLVEGMGSYLQNLQNVWIGEGRPVEARGLGVEGDFFEVLGVRPALGRLLGASDGDISGDPLVAVISERLWGSLFGRAPDVIGKRLSVGDHSLSIVGVAGGGFAGPERGSTFDVWMPEPAMWMLMGAPLDQMMGREAPSHGSLLIRPRPGVTLEAVEEQLAASLERIAAGFPESAEQLSSTRPVVMQGLHAPPFDRETTYRSMAMLGGVVGLVLLIACANVANLLLFRSVGRRGEVATRRAFGASAGRIARQHVVESLAIAVLGTALGLGAGWLLGLPFRGLALTNARMPFDGVAFDVRFLLFGGATVLLTTLLFGAAPALLAGGSNPGRALADAGMRGTGRGSALRSGMAATQLGLSMALLVGAFLLVRTLGNLYSTDTGISFERVASVNLDLSRVPVPEHDAVHRSIVSAVEAVPGVEAAALDLPGPFLSITYPGRVRPPEAPDSASLRTTIVRVTPGWFDVLGVQPVSGTTFRPEDWAQGAPGRVIVSQGLARRLFATESVVGRAIAAGEGRPVQDAEIIGVIPDLRLGGPGSEPSELFILPLARNVSRIVTVMARTEVLDGRVLADITAAVERALPNVPVPAAVPLRNRIDTRLAEQRLFARMIGLVAALSVLLAAVGLYGVVAFAVAGRRREMGIRLALGADGRSLASLIGRYALGIVSVGMALGLAGGYAIGQLLESRLFGITAADASTYGVTALLFAGITALACWAPARAATRVDPVVSLRAE